MSQTHLQLPRRLDKEWRRQYDKLYRERTKEHRKQQTKEYRSRPDVREKIKLGTKQWYSKNKSMVMFRHRQRDSTIEGKIIRWKKGAKRRGIEWKLSVDFILNLPRICHYTGLPLVLEVGKANTLSIDRIDSNKDYSENNVRPCCSMVNAMKREFDEIEFVEMCKKIANHHEQLVN